MSTFILYCYEFFRDVMGWIEAPGGLSAYVSGFNAGVLRLVRRFAVAPLRKLVNRLFGEQVETRAGSILFVTANLCEHSYPNRFSYPLRLNG
jgi:hypothetical protein